MKFKDDVVAARFDDMSVRAQMLALEMDNWLMRYYGIEMTITATTSTAEEDKALERISSTHREGRAFDVRTTDIPDHVLAEFIAEFRKKYKTLGAQSGGQYNLIVYRPHGTGPHLHIQISRKYSRVIKGK